MVPGPAGGFFFFFFTRPGVEGKLTPPGRAGRTHPGSSSACWRTGFFIASPMVAPRQLEVSRSCGCCPLYVLSVHHPLAGSRSHRRTIEAALLTIGARPAVHRVAAGALGLK